MQSPQNSTDSQKGFNKSQLTKWDKLKSLSWVECQGAVQWKYWRNIRYEDISMYHFTQIDPTNQFTTNPSGNDCLL